MSGSPVCLVLAALFLRQLLVEGGGGAPLAADPAVASRAVLRRRLPPSSPSAGKTGVGGVGVLLQGLQLGQGDDVAGLGPVPHRALGGGVVVVEARGVRVKQLPPLVVAGPLDADALRGVPHALARLQVGVHALPRARLDDLYPLQPAGGQVTVFSLNTI